MTIDTSNIVKVYSGKLGKCMCGCSGKWSYTKDGAKDYGPGYDVSVSDRSVKIIAGKVLKHPEVQYEHDYAFIESDNRQLVVYFKT